MGGVIITLTREIDELTYELSLTTCRLILVEHLGGLFFDGRRFCIYRRFFCWSFGSVLWQLSCSGYTSLCVRQSAGFKWQCAALNNGVLILVMASLH